MAVAGLLLAISAIVVFVHMKQYSTLSPLDELQHVDYLERASELEFVRANDRVEEPAMREQACRGIDAPGFPNPPCHQEELDPSAFQELGYNTAAADPPLYYYSTGLVARAVDLLPGVDSIVTGARALGALWLAAGLLLTYLLARRLGATGFAALGVCLLLAGTPGVLHSAATVTSDSPQLLVGALCVLMTLAAVRSEASAAWPGVAAALACLVKVTGLAVVGMSLIFVLAMMLPWGNRTADGSRVQLEHRRGLLIMAGLVAGALLPTLIWRGLIMATALPSPPEPEMARFEVDSIGSEQILGTLYSTFSPVWNSYTPPVLASALLLAIVAAFNILLLASNLGAAWSTTTPRQVQLLGFSTVVGMLLAAPFFVLVIFLGAHAYFAIPSRYGLSLLPAAVAVFACVVSQRRRWDIVLLVAGFVGVAVALKNLLF